MRVRLLLPVAAAVLAVGVAGGLVGGASASSEPSVLTFTDPAGDSAGAPDVTNVTINGDEGTGMITFSVTATGFKPTNTDGLVRYVDVWLNADRNRSTGSAGGDEYDIYVWTDTSAPGFMYSIDRWSGTSWQQVPHTATMSSVSKGDTYSVTVSEADLGGAKNFALDVGSVTFDPTTDKVVARDDATESFSWVYDISGPTSTIYTFATPTIGKPILAPAQIRAGTRVTVSFRVGSTALKKNEPLTRGTMVCDPSVAGRVVPHAESFKNGVARLSFVVPKMAKGKQLKVKVTIKADSYRDKGGVWIDINNGYAGLTANNVSGKSTTKVVAFPVR